MKKLALASIAVLALGVLLVPYALAANLVIITVLNDGVPVQDAIVELICSDGRVSGVTDENGDFTVDISGTYFRLRIMDTVFSEPFNVEQSPVVIDLNEL